MVSLTFSNSGDVLVVRARLEPSILNGLLAALATGCFCIFALRTLLRPSWAFASATVLLTGLSFLLATRRRTNELRVSKNGITSRGRVGDSFGSKRQVNPGDVKWLEYQEDTTGPETSYHPEGLYAVLGRRSVCILPNIDRQQATTVIEQIQKSFPDLSRNWASQSSFGTNLISLNL